MVSKDEVITQIQRIAKAEGAPPGYRRFEIASGIAYHEWYGRYWAKWGDALVEAGFGPNDFQGQLPTESVVEHYVELIQSLGRIPTEGDIRLARHANPLFPSHNALRRHLGSKQDRLKAALTFLSESGSTSKALEIIQSALDAIPLVPASAEVEEIDIAGNLVTGFVYLMKSGKYYKIGKTNSIDRRKYEIGLHVAEGVKPIHSIETDDPSGIEAYWHNRFKDKRMNGEWFNLSASDIRAFKLRKKFM
jgi:hypothetical protein